MEHDQVKTALDGVWHAVARVKGRGARLRHDHAIERANDAGVGIAPKWGEYHRVSPARGGGAKAPSSGRLSFPGFGRRADAGRTQG